MEEGRGITNKLFKIREREWDSALLYFSDSTQAWLRILGGHDFNMWPVSECFLQLHSVAEVQMWGGGRAGMIRAVVLSKPHFVKERPRELRAWQGVISND